MYFYPFISSRLLKLHTTGTQKFFPVLPLPAMQILLKLMDLIKDILSHAGWLNTKLFQNAFFFFDLWSVVHLWSGFVIFLLLRSLKIKRSFLVITAILILYEISGKLFLYFAYSVFKPETIQDQLTDIVAGIGGGILAYSFLRFAGKDSSMGGKTTCRILVLLASFTYAFPWVGFYGYHYNTAWLNTPGINLTAFLLWTTGTFITIQIFRSLKFRNLLVRLLFTWMIYLVILFAFEFNGYVIMRVHENSVAGATPLLFGLIHGSRVLHIFYMVSPLCTITLYSVFSWLTFKTLDARVPEQPLTKEARSNMATDF